MQKSHIKSFKYGLVGALTNKPESKTEKQSFKFFLSTSKLKGKVGLVYMRSQESSASCVVSMDTICFSHCVQNGQIPVLNVISFIKSHFSCFIFSSISYKLFYLFFSLLKKRS